MIEQDLTRCVLSWYPGATGVAGAAKLSGGASQETWSFDIVHAVGRYGAILRRSPRGYGAAPTRAARFFESSSSIAVKISTGKKRSAVFSRSQTSNPDSPGRMRSRMTKSGFFITKLE